MLKYIDAHRNCEDIAMAFLVANATGSPPVYVRAPGLQDLGQGVRKVGNRMAPADVGLPRHGGVPLLKHVHVTADSSMLAMHLMVPFCRNTTSQAYVCR